MANELFLIDEELKKLPDQPGVYIMHDSTDAIIYVGKALSLTKRVHQYFQPSHDEGIKKKQMVSHISRFEYIVTDSELEALVLENNLIKEHKPKYNTLLRDDKTYPYIKVTVREDYPRILFSRQSEKDGSRYFGPFTSGTDVRSTIDLANKLFSLRSCNKKFPEAFGKDRPCLNFHMGQCLGVCTGNISKEQYRKNVDAALDFLAGNVKPVLNDLTEKMNRAASLMEFEKAATYRDLIDSVNACTTKQKITDTDGEDKDIVAMAKSGEDAVIQVFFIRGGRMIGRDHFFMNIRLDDEPSELLLAFLMQFYSGTPFIPKELYIQEELPEGNILEEYLSKKRGNKVRIRTPKRGQKEKLVELAKKNARMVLTQDKERIRREEGRTIGAMKELAELLSLEGISRMEAYDISHISGFATVGSMVVFEKGKPLRSDYRKFKLRTIEGPDDYASMREVLTRRFTHGMEERENSEEDYGKFSRFPDIIMMDGGKGQVNIALEVLSELGLDIPVAGMVKDDHHRTRGLYFNNIEIPIERTSEGFKLITRLQDEAHRFAIEYHRSLRSKAQVHSFLDDIPGIGPKRRKALMKRFISADALREASIEDIAETESMNIEAARAVYDYLHQNEKGQ
ncbi:MAG: excinuclease ABC subunit UvrC [Lachnospiraceae bacterium]|nr:excinuclease ABC subunit UvrC [Lachnospiraceae bacterium]